MTKEMFLKICSFPLFILITGCVSNSPVPDSYPPSSLERQKDSVLNLPASRLVLEKSTPTLPVLWSRKMRGAVSDFSVSHLGQAILVATSPDSDIEGSSNHYLLTRFSPKGKVIWEVKVQFPSRELDLSADGSLGVVANYENQVFGVDAKGKTIWSIEDTCRPHILNQSKKIICYHDDDAEPQTAFDVLDWSGKKLLSYPIAHDVLALKISPDEKNVVLALAGGRVLLLGEDYRALWEKRVEGEVIDVSVSSGEAKTVVLLKDQNKKQKLVAFNTQGNVIGERDLGLKSVQVELSQAGDRVFYYGDGVDGQFVGSYALPGFTEGWKKGSIFSAYYSSSIFVTPKLVFMGFEQVMKSTRQIHLLAFNSEGKIQWNVAVLSDEEAYLYAHRFALSAALMVVATDDAKLSVYEVPKALE